MHTFGDVIGLWPSVKEFAGDIGITPLLARQMRNRDSISAKYWQRIIDAADERDIPGVTYEALAALAARRRAA